MNLSTAANWAQILSIAPLLAGAAALWRHHCCATPRCVRIARHKVPDTAWLVCTRHHTAPHHAQLRDRYRAAHPAGLTHQDTA